MRGVVLLVVWLGSASGWAQDLCQTPRAPLGSGPAELGAPVRPCAAADVAVRLYADATLDVPDFYGALAGRLSLTGGLRVGEGLRLFGAFDVLTYRYVVDAVVVSTQPAVGPASVGLGRSFARADRVLMPYLRVLLPVDGARRDSWQGAVEPGTGAAWSLGSRTVLRAHAALPVVVTHAAGWTRTALHAVALGDVAFAWRPWLRLSAGPAVRVRVFGEPGTAHLTSGSLRGAVGLVRESGWGFVLGVEGPVIGRDRSDLRVAAFVQWEPSPS